MRTLPIFLYLLLFMPVALLGQRREFTPVTFNPQVNEKLLASIKSRYEADIASVTGPNKKYITDIYKERYEYIRLHFENKEVITDTAINDYLQQIAREIISKNPSLQKTSSLRILFSKSPLANASSLGEGTILFNIGLFNRLDNEAQVAFVLAHELAHYYLDHGNDNIDRYIQNLYSEETQKQLRSISKTEFNRNKQLENLALNLGFRSRRHSRLYESSADSMAIELLKNTGFRLEEAVTTMSILDSSDQEKYYTELNLEENFSFPGFTFRKSWLSSGSLRFVDSEEELAEKKKLADSLKTHPDCSIRSDRIRIMLSAGNKNSGQAFLVDKEKFHALKNLFDYEMIEHSFESGRVSYALYLSILLYLHDRSDAYAAAMIGKCWNRIYTAQKIHELGKIVDLPNPSVRSEYNTVLHLIQNLRLSEIAELSYHFLYANREQFRGNEEYVAALVNSMQNYNKPDERAEWIRIYNNFSNRKYQFN